MKSRADLARRLIPSAALLAILLVFFYRIVFLAEVFSPADLLFSHTPWREAYGFQPPSNHTRSDEVFLHHPVMASHWARLKKGELAQLDPWQLAGEPAFLQNMFVGLTVNPLAIFYYMFSAPVADSLFAIARLWVAGLFMYAYCRRIGLAAVAAATAAIAFMLNGHFIAWLATPIPTVGVWLPLGLLAAERMLHRPGSRTAVLLALALAPLYIGGYTPTAIISAVIVGLYVVVGSMRAPRTLAVLAWSAVGALWSTVVGAIGLIPTFANLRGSDLLHRVAGLHAYPGANLATFVFRDFWGTPLDMSWWYPFNSNYLETVTYLGLAPLVLAPLAVVSVRSWRSWFFGAVGVVVLGYVYGLPGCALVGKLPVLRSLNNFRWIFALAVATSVLSGMAIDALVRGVGQRSLLARITPALCAIGALACYVWFARVAWSAVPEPYTPRLVAGGLRGAIFLGAAVVALTFLQRDIGPRAMLSGLIAAFVAVDLVSAQIDFNPTLPIARVFPATPAIRWLQQHAADSRIAFAGNPPIGLLPGTVSAIYGLRSLGGYDFAGEERYQQLVASARVDSPAPPHSGYVFLPLWIDPASPVFDLLGARFIVTPRDVDFRNRRPIAAVAESNTTPGEIVNGRVVGQTLVCPLPGLTQIDVYPGTYARTNAGILVFHLREEGSTNDLVTRTFRLDRVANNLRMPIEFPPLPDSAGKRYRFWFESPGATTGRAITLWINEQDTYPGGVRLEGGHPVAGDLRFTAYVDGSRDTTLRTVYQGDLNIIENLDVLPSAWQVRETEVADPNTAIARLAAGFPIRSRAMVDRPVQLRGTASQQSDRVEVERPAPETLVVHLTLGAPGLLVMSEKFDLGWRASLDDRPAELLRVNGILCGIVVPEGTHTVRLAYRNRPVLAGFIVTVSGLAVALMIIGVSARGSQPKVSRAEFAGRLHF